MKKSHFILSFIFLLIYVTGNAQQVCDPEFNNMLSKLLKHSVDEIIPSDNISQNTIFLDARESKEFKVSHLPNAINVGYDKFNIKKWQHLDKEKPIIVYCTVGYRSEKVAEKLKKNGFKNVKNLYGGIFEWAQHNKPLISNDKITDSIHTYNKEWSQWLQKGIKVY